ncbi:MAG: TrkH family potassium uptake protein [Eubacteriales bacterium]|nr:TrkH family potassium uptake protein [Eubacteriales bacterium]
MNISIVAFIIGTALLIEGALMVAPLICTLFYGEPVMPFIITIFICLVLGFLMRKKKIETGHLLSKEGVVSTGLCWIVLSLTGMLPFIFSGAIVNPVDAFFETVSGFTTTGSTILTEIESLPRGVLLWRSLMHWIGGMGILVFMLALMPLSGGTQMNLFKAESPGPSISKLVPKAQDTAKILYSIYGAMTVITAILLMIFRMPVFDAICIAFGAAGTGGFGVLNSGCADYTYAQQVIITIAMASFGINFNFFFFIFIIRKTKEAFAMEEVRTYILIIFVAIAAITLDLVISGVVRNPLLAFHEASFHTCSIITTTGFATVDMNMWPALSRTIIVMLSLLGACAGSTGGGLKVARLMLLVKSLGRECNRILHPQAVRKVHMDGRVVDDVVVHSTSTYFFIYIIGMLISILLISVDNKGWDTTISAVIATFNNIGPGFGMVGSMGNYADFSAFAKIILAADMLIGRLEIFPILLLFSRRTWKKF